MMVLKMARGQIIPRKNGFTIRVYIGRDADGKKKYQNQRVTGTKKEAQKVLTAMLQKMDMGELLLNPSTQTVEAYGEDWLETIAKMRVSASTFKNYCHYLRHHIFPKVGKSKLTRLQARDIQKIYNDQLDRGLSARTVQYTHAVLSSALKHAVGQKLLPSNPCDHVQLPKKESKEMNAMNDNSRS